MRKATTLQLHHPCSLCEKQGASHSITDCITDTDEDGKKKTFPDLSAPLVNPINTDGVETD